MWCFTLSGSVILPFPWFQFCVALHRKHDTRSFSPSGWWQLRIQRQWCCWWRLGAEHLSEGESQWIRSLLGVCLTGRQPLPSLPSLKKISAKRLLSARLQSDLYIAVRLASSLLDISSRLFHLTLLASFPSALIQLEMIWLHFSALTVSSESSSRLTCINPCLILQRIPCCVGASLPLPCSSEFSCTGLELEGRRGALAWGLG